MPTLQSTLGTYALMRIPLLQGAIEFKAPFEDGTSTVIPFELVGAAELETAQMTLTGQFRTREKDDIVFVTRLFDIMSLESVVDGVTVPPKLIYGESATRRFCSAELFGATRQQTQLLICIGWAIEANWHNIRQGEGQAAVSWDSLGNDDMFTSINNVERQLTGRLSLPIAGTQVARFATETKAKK